MNRNPNARTLLLVLDSSDIETSNEINDNVRLSIKPARRSMCICNTISVMYEICFHKFS